MPSTRSETTRALHDVIDRFGADRLAGDPRLCRNALRDRLPDDPGTVSVLCAALEVDVVNRLTARGADPALVVKQSARALARLRSIDQRTSAWAVSAWAGALGVVDPTEETLVVDRPLPVGAEALASTAETVRRPSPPTTAPVPVPVATRTTPAARVQVGSPTRQRRVRPWMIVAAVAVLLLGIVGGIVALAPHAPAARFTASATGGAEGVVTSGSKAYTLTGTSRKLAVGDRVKASHGPLTVRLGSRTVVRLDAGTTARVENGTGGADETLHLTAGRLYVNAAGAEPAIDSTAGIARPHGAQLIANCTSDACTYQSLQKTVPLSRASTSELQPHEYLTTAEVNASSSSKTGFTTPDALRADPWLTSNATLDRKRSLPAPAVSGPSVLGPWKVAYAPKGNALVTVSRQVTISDDCSAGSGCTLSAVSTYSTCPGHAAKSFTDKVFSCVMKGPVTASDGSGANLAIDWGSNPVDCTDGTTHPVDGHGSYRDTFDVTSASGGTALTGRRVAHFQPIGQAGSVCSDAGRSLTDPTIPFSGKKGTVPRVVVAGTDRTQSAEDMIDHHVASGVRCRSAAPPKSAQAEKVCSFTGPTDRNGTERPKGFTLIQYLVKATRLAAYQQLSTPAGRRSSGNCSTGPCEQPFTAQGVQAGARVATWSSGGSAHLVAFAPARTATIVLATGSDPQTLYRWLADRDDFRLSPFPFFGL